MRRNRVAALLFSAAILCGAIVRLPFAPNRARAAAMSRAECVVEVTSRRILFEKNADEPLPMASTTKILTALIVIEDCDLEEELAIPPAAAGVEGSSVYLKAGELYTVRDLLYGLMLRSGNDCAVALALHHSGSIEKFAREMTERAALMGATSSTFANPHGLPAPSHRTTARDLALIAAYAMENETFRTIVSCKKYEPRGWTNKNKMLLSQDANGVKTGFTTEAGRCLVSAAKRGGMQLVSVTLNSSEMYERSAELLDSAFSDYAMYPLCTAGIQPCGYARYGFSYPLTEAERGCIRTEFLKEEGTRGEIAGLMKIYLRNNLLFSQNLYMIDMIESTNSTERQSCESTNFWRNRA